MPKLIHSAAPETWRMATGFDYTNAYGVTHRKPMYPREDHLHINSKLAEALYEIGKKAAPIHPSEAALPVFQLVIEDIDPADYSSSFWDAVHPSSNPSTDYEFGIYCITLLFSVDETQIACDIGYDFGIHSGGGHEDIGTVGIMVDGDTLFSFPRYMDRASYEEFGLYDYTSITKLCDRLGYIWRGIQYQFIHRPERIRFTHHRLKHTGTSGAGKQAVSKVRVAKVQRVITILMDEKEEAKVVSSGRHKITLSLWSVAGHWRVTKSGKRIWIAPYYKGKDRNKEHVHFDAKEYRFDEEVFQ